MTEKQHLTIVKDGEIIFEGMVALMINKVETMVVPVPQKSTASFFTNPPSPMDGYTMKTETMNKITVNLTTQEYHELLTAHQVAHQVTHLPALPSYREIQEKYRKTLEQNPEAVAELLEKAAEILERDAWCRHSYHTTIRKKVPLDDDEGVTLR